jgi:CheY-like chemotaxis protein
MLAGTRVLVVEDEALISMMLEDFLTEIGCEVVATAARLSDAVEKARTVAMDIAVLDVNLAGQVSYPVAEILRQRAIPFLFATGYGTDGLPENLRGAQVLSKPFMLEQLSKALDVAIAK